MILKIIHRPGQDVSRVLYLTIIYLDIPLPACSSDLPPGGSGQLPGMRRTPIWSCSGWGLHETHVTMGPRELLPHDFTLTALSGGMFLLHFPYSYLRRTLSGILALRSPDFPHSAERAARLSVLPGSANLITMYMDLYQLQPL